MNPDLTELLQLLVERQVRFLVVGGFAFTHYAEPRYTKDIDLLVATDAKNAKLVHELLTEFGAPLQGAETSFFMDERSFLIIGFPPNRVDVLMSIPGVDFENAYSNREHMVIDGFTLPVIGLDDLIAAKLASGRPQDLIDAENLQVAKRVRDGQES